MKSFEAGNTGLGRNLVQREMGLVGVLDSTFVGFNPQNPEKV